MRYVPSGAPFSERGGRLRGVVDLLAGRYPPFLFGLGVRDVLPVFHFHETTGAALEPAFHYLVENGYRTVTADDMAAFALEGRRLPPKSVVLAFDDALASVWLVATPLLRRYGLSAVTYAIPGRITHAAGVRPTIDDGPVDAEAADRSANPFATWEELRAASTGGWLDVQSHTWSHTMMASAATPVGVVTPAWSAEHPLNRPRLNSGDPPEFLAPDRIGYPLFPSRSRMSDAMRVFPDVGGCLAVENWVRERGGADFLARPGWQRELAPRLAAVTSREETPAERVRAIEYELAAARDAIEGALGTRVRHVCLPWGVTGRVTEEALGRLGFTTAVANRWTGMYAVRRGDHPYYLKRLPSRHLFALPGKGRRAFRTLA